MTYHSGSHLIHTRRKRTANHNSDTIILNNVPIAIQTKSATPHSSYRSIESNSDLFQSLNITYNDPSIDVTPTISPSSIIAQKQQKRYHRHYRDRHENKNEVFEVCKWCIFCLAALGSCIVFISYLLAIVNDGNNANDHKSSSTQHHFSKKSANIFTHHHASLANSYLNTHKKSISLHPIHTNNDQTMNSSNIQRIPIELQHNDHFAANDLSIVNKKKMKIQMIESERKYKLIRSDKNSILSDILFVVFKKNNDQNTNNAIKKSWAQKYKNLYDINIKFVNTQNYKFEYDADVIDVPFDAGQSAMCLLWLIDEYMDEYKWLFVIDDATFVMIENLINYLTQIELESSLIAHAKDRNYHSTEHHYYWWLGNTKNVKMGYLINRDVMDLIVDEMNNAKYDKESDKYLLCDGNGKYFADECIEYLLNEKYNIHVANTLDFEGNEKFINENPMSLLLEYEHISNTPIMFGEVSDKWMHIFYDLLYLHQDAKDIAVLDGDDAEIIKQLNDYATLVMKYAVGDRIQNIKNEMQQIIVDINYNLVK